MERYLYTLRRYRWIAAVIVLILGVSASIAAYGEYVNTYESNATIWVSRNSQDVLRSTELSTDQSSVPNFLTPGGEYAETFGQMIQSQAFLAQVVARTSLEAQLAASVDPLAFFDDVRKRFKVQALGTNLVRVSYRAESPTVAYEMVVAALSERDQRTAQQQVGTTSVTTAYYQKEYELAKQETLQTQQELDRFNASHSAPLNTTDDYTQRQLRLASDLAQVRVNDIKTRIDRASIASGLQQLAGGNDIQVLDQPQEQPRPSGGIRQAAFVFGVMMSGAVALLGLLIVLGTLLTGSVASEADLVRLGEASLLAAIPQITRGRGRDRIDIRTSLAGTAFGIREEAATGAAS